MARTKPYKYVVETLKRNGWTLRRTTGSHEIYVKKGYPSCPVKCNKKDIPAGTLTKIEKITGIKF